MEQWISNSSKSFCASTSSIAARLLTKPVSYCRYVAVSRRSGLEEAEQFEHNHDNDDYSDYVEDVSVHAGDS
jgi:hypothetical protein